MKFAVSGLRLLFETNVTKVISKNVLVKSSEKTLFFTCILPDYVVHENPKEFWKSNHFENMRASFLRRCQILLWQTSPEIMHFKVC